MRKSVLALITAAIAACWMAAVSSAASVWRIDTVAQGGDVGFHNSLAFDPADGNPSVVYSDNLNDRTLFAHWNGESWDIEPVGDGEGPTTLVYIGPGSPTLAYNSHSADDIIYARPGGSGWDAEVVDGSAAEGEASLAYDADGNPGIAYRRRGRGRNHPELTFAHRLGGSWERELIDVDTHMWFSLALVGGHFAVAYQKAGVLRYAERNGSSWDVQVLSAGAHPTLTVDAAGRPAIAYLLDAGGGYQTTDAWLARYDGTSWTHHAVTTDGGLFYCDLDFDSTGTAYVAYLDVYPEETQETLFLAQETAPASDTYDVDTVHHDPNEGALLGLWRLSLALIPDERPAIAYPHEPSHSGTRDLLYAQRLGPCLGDADCDDGSACTAEACIDGACELTWVNDCDDEDPCTVDSCDPESGDCIHWPDPSCPCAGSGGICTDDSDCCSGKCRPAVGPNRCR